MAISTIKAAGQQNIFDLALQVYGKVEGAFILAQDNDRVLSDIVGAGDAFDVDEDNIINQSVVNYFSGLNTKPASNSEVLIDGEKQGEGIGYWAIGTDFIVS